MLSKVSTNSVSEAKLIKFILDSNFIPNRMTERYNQMIFKFDDEFNSTEEQEALRNSYFYESNKKENTDLPVKYVVSQLFNCSINTTLHDDIYTNLYGNSQNRYFDTYEKAIEYGFKNYELKIVKKPCELKNSTDYFYLLYGFIIDKAIINPNGTINKYIDYYKQELFYCK